MQLSKQVEKQYYNWSYYMDKERWVSFYHQISHFHKMADCQSFLEIGAGLDVNRKHFEEFLPEKEYRTLDIAEDLSPDFVGSAHKIPLADNSFDAVVAFEILEHIPFDQFETALNEIKRVARKRVVISLPHFGPPIKFLLKVPFLKQVEFACKIPYHPVHRFNGQHYWEIGKKGYSVGKIRSIFKKHFILEDDFVPFENQYHHFFVLKIPE